MTSRFRSDRPAFYRIQRVLLEQEKMKIRQVCTIPSQFGDNTSAKENCRQISTRKSFAPHGTGTSWGDNL